MELQTFTFFLLAFVALTDGGLSWGRRPWGFPRDLMDDSIDMTKPENAKAADLARARRQEPGGFEPIDIESDEAQMAKNLALDWWDKLHAPHGHGLVFHFKSAEKQVVESGVNYLINGEGERERDGLIFQTQFQVYIPLEGEQQGDPQISQTFPGNNMYYNNNLTN